MTQQTGIINEARLLSGAWEFYIGDSIGSLFRLGAYRDASVQSKRESTELIFDNDKINKFKKGKEFSFTFVLWEIDPDTLASMNKGWITKTAVAGTEVAWATQAIANPTAWQIVELEGQMHDLSLVSVTWVSGSTDGALTVNTDYVVIKWPGGKSNIYFIAGGNITTMSQTFTVTYTYTPAASVTFTFADNGIATKFYARFVHERNDGKQVVIDLEDVQNIQGLTIDFVGNEEDDVATVSVELSWKVMDNGFKYEV